MQAFHTRVEGYTNARLNEAWFAAVPLLLAAAALCKPATDNFSF